MSIVTRTGDRGKTGLFGSQRTSKASTRMHAIGTVDELNALLGQVLAKQALPASVDTQLTRIQHFLFVVGADIATPSTPLPPPSLKELRRTGMREETVLASTKTRRITENHVGTLERWIDELEGQLPPLQAFILPGGSRSGALLHSTRTVCRRAERWVVALKEEGQINPQVLRFLNRLGDYFFLLARTVNRAEEVEEKQVRYE